jgi:cell division protein FtsB
MKHIFYTVALCVQCMLFIYVFIYGNKGWLTLRVLKQEVVQGAQAVDRCTEKIVQLKSEAELWATDPFYKEKIAREELQMARKGDEIFYIN